MQLSQRRRLFLVRNTAIVSYCQLKTTAICRCSRAEQKGLNKSHSRAPNSSIGCSSAQSAMFIPSLGSCAISEAIILAYDWISRSVNGIVELLTYQGSIRHYFAWVHARCERYCSKRKSYFGMSRRVNRSLFYTFKVAYGKTKIDYRP